MPPIHVNALINQGALLFLPKDASEKLASRGMAMIKGTMNGFPFQAVVEPNGKGSHWFRVTGTLREGARVTIGDTVSLEIEPSNVWPEPKVPVDLKTTLETEPEAYSLWQDITPMARWDWIRWIGATKVAETRKRRIVVTCSKLSAGKRRPCCFNLTECTLTDA